MGIKDRSFTTTPPIIASFDFQDIADGTGVVKFNGYTTRDSNGLSYALNRFAFFSNQIETTVGPTVFSATSFVKILDIDIDLGQFNASRIAEGRATIQTSFAVERTAGPGNLEMFIKYIIVKVSGGVETIIGTGQTETITRVSTGITKVFVTLDISLTRTHFATGDSLRLTVEGWGRNNAGGDVSGKITIVHDPQDRDGTVITPASDDFTTKLDFYNPFKIQK